MNKIIDREKPEVIQNLGNNNYYFNYDIKEESKDIDEEGKEIINYSYIQIKLRGIPEYKEVVKLLIREYISDDKEFELINDYNKYKLGIIQDKKVKDDYIEYLNLVEEIKTKIKSYFNK